MIPARKHPTLAERLLALTLACRQARAIMVRYRILAKNLKLGREEEAAEHAIHQIDDALRK